MGAGALASIGMTAQLPDAPPNRAAGRAARSNRLALAVAVWFCALAAFAVIPFGAGWQIWHYHVDGEIANVSIALILIFALGSIGVYGAIIGGWASQSKF